MSSTTGTMSYQQYRDNIAKTKLSERIRTVAIAMTQFRVLARVEPSFGANQGHTVAFEKYQKLSQNPGAISEFAELPLKKPTVNEGTVTIQEHGDGVAYTKKAKSIAEYAIDEQLRRLLEMNVTETMDTIVGTEFQTADVFYIPTGTTGTPTGTVDKDGTVSTAATRSLQAWDFRYIGTQLKVDRIPTYDGSRYLAVCNPWALWSIFNDTHAAGYVEMHKYDMPEALIKGEIGAYFGFRFVEETNVLSSTLNNTAFNGEVIIIGDDAVVEALVQPEMIKMETWNFDRFIGIAWNTYTGFEKIWTNSIDGQYQIMRIWSQAV